MANHPKRHHYLAQTIQRNFLAEDETLLWFYDRKKDKYEQRTPKGLAHARHLYSYDGVTPEERYALEEAFSVLEGKATPIFLKLKNGEDISQEEHTVIAEFVGMQYFRTPVKLEVISEVAERGSKYIAEVMRRDIENMSDEAFQKYMDDFNKQSGKEPSKISKQRVIEQLRSGTIKINNPKNFQLQALVDAGTNLGIKFSGRRWLVLHTEPGHEFITSDVGLHLTMDGKATKATGFGPGSPGMATIFPFAKDAALMITSMTIPVDLRHVPFEDDYLHKVNAGLARVSGELYSSNRSLLENLVEKGKLAKTSFRPTFNEAEMQSTIPKHLLK